MCSPLHVPWQILSTFAPFYGPRLQANDGRVISSFMMQALRGEPLTIYGDGLQTRSFCYVSDLIAGILRLAESNESTPVNIGNLTEFTMLECANEILSVPGSRSAIVHQPLPKDDPTRRRPDIAKARALLGWGAHSRPPRRPPKIPHPSRPASSQNKQEG